MPDSPLHLAIIIGSTRQGRFAPTVATWFADRARSRPDLIVDVIEGAMASLSRRLWPASLGALARLAWSVINVNDG